MKGTLTAVGVLAGAGLGALGLRVGAPLWFTSLCLLVGFAAGIASLTEFN